MQVDWTSNSQADVSSIRAYIAEHDVVAANKMMLRIISAGDALVDFANRGRPTGIPNVRELVIPSTPYLLAYRVEDDLVQILSVWHGAQDRNSAD